MANSIGMIRNYHLADGDLALFTRSLAIAMTRDLTELTTYGVTSLKITALTDLCDDFQALPDDEIFRADMSYAVEQRDVCRDAVLNTIRSISVRAKAVFGENSAKYRSISPGNITKLTDSELLVSARQVHSVAVTNLTALTPEGITAPYLATFDTAVDAFSTSITGIVDKKIIRDDKAEERVIMGNELYALVLKYCDYGKTIWDGVSPSKYNDYIIYLGAPGGILTAPTGFAYNYSTNVFDWDTVANASSYQVEMSDNGADWTEIYADIVEEFNYVPDNGIEKHYRVRARNSGGYGPYSTELAFTYFSSLEMPVNLTLGLTGGTPPFTIHVNWETVPGAEKYEVYHCTVPIGSPAGAFTFSQLVGSNTYTEDTNIGFRHYFYVIAVNSYLRSPHSGSIFMDL